MPLFLFPRRLHSCGNKCSDATGKLSIQAGKRVTLVFQANNLPLSRRINALLRFGFHLHPTTRFRILPQFGGFAQALIRLDSNESRYLMRSLGMLSRTKSGQEVFRGLQQSILRRNCCARSLSEVLFWDAEPSVTHRRKRPPSLLFQTHQEPNFCSVFL